MVRDATRVLNKARSQLPKDRPSIAMIDAYEPLLQFPPSEREAQRRLIYTALEETLTKHGRPTGVFLAAPAPAEEHVTRSFVYAGNKQPSTPFPEKFALFSGWAPAHSAPAST